MLKDEQDVGNEAADFRIKNLSWQNILSNRQIAADIEEKWANQEKSFVKESVVFTFLRQANGNHDTEP